MANFKLINGDALFGKKDKKHQFCPDQHSFLTKPYSDTTEFGQSIAKQFFLLGGGKPMSRGLAISAREEEVHSPHSTARPVILRSARQPATRPPEISHCHARAYY